jgi:hypothetical protein
MNRNSVVNDVHLTGSFPLNQDLITNHFQDYKPFQAEKVLQTMNVGKTMP